MKTKYIAVISGVIVMTALTCCHSEKKFGGTYYGLLNNNTDTIFVQGGPTQGSIWLTENDSGYGFEARVHGNTIQNLIGQTPSGINWHGSGELNGNNLTLKIYGTNSSTAADDTLVFMGIRR